MLTIPVLTDALALVREYRPDIAAVLDTLLPFHAQPLELGTDGRYDSSQDTITLRSTTDFDAETLAAVLIHEGTHALDNRTGNLPKLKRTLQEATQPEVRAFEASARFWMARHPYGREPRTRLDIALNDDVRQMRNGTLGATITDLYGQHWRRQVAEAMRVA